MTPECRLRRFEETFREYVANPQVAGTADEFRGYKETHCGLWVSGEEGNEVDGRPAFSYWSMSERYEFGVHRSMDAFLDRHGAYADWYDPGTVVIYLEAVA